MGQVTARVYQITTQFFNNMYLIRGDEGYTLVDTGMGGKASLHAIGRALTHQGAGWDALHTIVITHAHIDHIGGLDAIQGRTQAITCAHPADTPIIQGKQAPIYANPIDLGIRDRLLRRFIITTPTPTGEVDMMIDEGDVLGNVAPDAQVIHLRGHSYGQIGLWLPDERTLIAGDAMMSMPWGLTSPFRVASPDWAEVYRSIERIADLAPDNLCLGHGRALIGDAATRVTRFYETWQERQ